MRICAFTLLVSCGLQLSSESPVQGIVPADAGRDVEEPIAADARAEFDASVPDAGPAVEYQHLAVGSSHTCVIINGTVKCWGWNEAGQLGTDGAFSPEPVLVPDLALEKIVSIGAGAAFTCALTTSGGVKCWGNNVYGELGNGSFAPAQKRGPGFVLGLESGVKSLAVGEYHACAVLLTGQTRCWGINNTKQLGDTTVFNRAAPTPVANLGADVVQVSAALYHTCARLTSGAVKCWGGNNVGQLGIEATAAPQDVVQVAGLTSDVRWVGSGASHSCVLQKDRALCWGYNINGELGTGSVAGSQPVPSPPMGLNGNVTRIAPGLGPHTCAIVDATVKCWGSALPWLPQTSIPVDIAGITNAAEVGAGKFHFCALTKTNQVYCWGDNTYGALGDNTLISRAAPMQVMGL
jgi:alpha-tubulin suppressor-like RCC1 family protein